MQRPKGGAGRSPKSKAAGRCNPLAGHCFAKQSVVSPLVKQVPPLYPWS
ncbi:MULTISPECIES: hypothetical protein [unclassified Providencia]|nr:MULTISPECIES: hypothetical protein [unclassified Providencia]